MASERTIDVNNAISDSYSQQPENLTSISAVPETEHWVATENQQEGQSESVGKDAAVGEKSREQEENDRDFSETIERLDSVLLEAGGEITVQVPGEKTTKTEEGVNLPISGGENNESTEVAAASGGVITVSGVDTKESVGEATVLVPAGDTEDSIGEATVLVPAGDTEDSVQDATALIATGEAQELVPTATLISLEGETPQSLGEVMTPLLGEEVQELKGVLVLEEKKVEDNTGHISGGDNTKLGGECAVGVIIDEAIAPTSGGVTPSSVGDNSESGGATGESLGVTEESAGEIPELTEEIIDLVSAAETPLEVPEPASYQLPEVTDQSTSQVSGPLVTLESDLVADSGEQENISPPLAQAGESWIDTLVRNIVTEVTTCAEVSGSSIEQKEEEAQVTAERKQVTLEERGAAEQVTDSPAQVASDSSDITVQVCEVQTGSPAQVRAGRVTESSVTPDPVAAPSREGTSDPGQPAACREKEWPPLICTGIEARADTGEQGNTQPGTPAMKDWEMEDQVVTPTPETPIEREIRLAMEREMMLRQERGIDVPVGEPELVEVRRRMVATEPAALLGKERKLAGAQMQREILLETQREQDLVEQGKVMGAYDRGDQQEVQEKKMIFESMNTEPYDPPFKRRQSELQKSTFIESPVVVVPIESNHVSAASRANVKKGPSYAEANGSNIIIIEHSSLLRGSAAGVTSSPAPQEPLSLTEFQRSSPADLRFSRSSSSSSPVPNSESPVTVPGSPFQVLRSASPRSLLEREIEEVQQREKELRRQRTSIYGKDRNVEENSQPENRDDILSGVYQPERPNWGKLEVNWRRTKVPL